MKFTLHCVSLPPFPGFLCANTAAKPKPAKAVLSFIVGTTGNFLLLLLSSCTRNDYLICQHVQGSKRLWKSPSMFVFVWFQQDLDGHSNDLVGLWQTPDDCFAIYDLHSQCQGHD